MILICVVVRSGAALQNSDHIWGKGQQSKEWIFYSALLKIHILFYWLCVLQLVVTVMVWERTKAVSLQTCQLGLLLLDQKLERITRGAPAFPWDHLLHSSDSCRCRHGRHGRVQLHWEQCVWHPHRAWSPLGPADPGCGLWILRKWFISPASL